MLNKTDILDVFHNSLIKSGYNNVEHENSRIEQFELFKIDGLHELKLHIIAKNITKSGWIDKPLIRRVQIGPIQSTQLPVSTLNESAFILGVIKIIDKYIFTVWSVYENFSHNTNRSCYVKIPNLFKAYIDGYYKCEDSSQMIWISDESNLNKLIFDYLTFNKTTLEK